jgi:hypothetical protein
MRLLRNRLWLSTAKAGFRNFHGAQIGSRCRSLTELTYQPMLEVMRLFRRQWLQDLLRHRRRPTLRPRVFRAGGRLDGRGAIRYDKNGKPTLTKVPKLLLNDDKAAGKPEGIHFVIGRQPVAVFGNSIGDKEMLEYRQAGGGARLMMLVHHDDAGREHYGPQSKVGSFPDSLLAEAKKQGWIVISMKSNVEAQCTREERNRAS